MVGEQEIKTTNNQSDDDLLTQFMDRARELEDVLGALWLLGSALSDRGYTPDVALMQTRDGLRPWLKTVTRWTGDARGGMSIFNVNCNISKTFVEFVPLEEEDDTDDIPF